MCPEVQTYKEVSELNAELADCQTVRDTLDELFNRTLSLETANVEKRHALFAHLETCDQCCRAFDARIRFGAVRRNSIY